MSIRKFLDRITSTKRFTSRRPKPLRAHNYQPRFEPLEQRQLLSVSPWSADLELTSNASSNVAQTPLVLAENVQAGPRLTLQDCIGASSLELQIDEVDSKRENLGKGLDAGDFYWYFDEKIPLLRLQDEIVVGLHDTSADKAAMTALTENSGALHGWEISTYLDSGQAVYKPSTASSNSEKGLSNISNIANAESVAWSAPAFCLADSGEQMILGDEIIVALGGGVDPTEFFASGYSSYHRMSGTPDQYVAVVEQGGGVTALETANSLKDDPRVQWATPNFYFQIETASTPNDTLFGDQWNMHNTGQTSASTDADADLPAAWDETTGSSSITIAILDDGVQLDHPDLNDNIWVNSGEIAGNGIDDDGNGWIDDVNGWDFYDSDNNPSPSATGDNHGTAVAGVAGAEGNNSLGVSGAAQNVGIMAIKIAEGDYRCSFDSIASAVYYAAGRTEDGLSTWNSADVLNCSWGLPENAVVTSAFDWANEFGREGLGASTFAASGNSASAYAKSTVNYTFQAGSNYQACWVYSKNATGSAGDDTAWLGQVEYPNGSIETFDSPTGWTTYGDANWVVVDEADDPSHNYGTSQNMLRAGTISDGQQSRLYSPIFSGTGSLTYQSWTSCEYMQDALFLYISEDGGQFTGVEYWTGTPTTATTVSYPASLDSTIAVGASTDWDFRSDYSQYGSALDFVAPSSGGFGAVTTTDRTGTAGYATGDYTNNFDGTSAAAPLAAGIAALMLSKNPNLTAEQVRTVLQDSADQIGGVTYTDDRNDYYGHGRVNAAAALGMIHVFTVDSTSDNSDANVGDGVAEDASGNTTLRAAIQEANANPDDLYTIILPDGYYRLDETGTGEDSALTGDLDITGNITIRSVNIGESTITANNIDRVFDVHNGGNLTLQGVSVTGGETPSTGSLYDQSGGGVRVNTGGNLLVKQCQLYSNEASWDGGAICVGGLTSPGSNAEIVDTEIYSNLAVNSGAGICITDQGGILDIKRSTISDNEGVDYGGGIGINAGTTTIASSTISGNESDSLGGGIWADGGTVDIKHSTIADNTTGSYGGGVRQTNTSTVSVYHTIIADNSAGTNGDDYYGTFDSDGYNLLEDTSGATITGTTTGNIYNTDPLLDVLAYNGGLTKTHKLLSNSPAIDTGDGSISNPPLTDQRGRLRLLDGSDNGTVRIDIGAYEAGITFVVNANSTGGNGINNSQADHFEVTRNGDNIEISIESTLSRSIPYNWLDSLIINGSNDDDTVTINNLGSDFIGSVTANADDGSDAFVIYDSSDVDELTVDPDAGTATMRYDYRGVDLAEIIANNFEIITANSNNGGSDRAILHDSDGNDQFVGTPSQSTMNYDSDAVIDVTVNDYGNVRAVGDNAGVDTAYLYDSSGDDTCEAGANYMGLYDSPSTYYFIAEFFENNNAYAHNGGSDAARLWDSAGNDIFTGTPAYGKMEYASGIDAYAEGFDDLTGYGNAGGTNTAVLEGSSLADCLVATTIYAQLNLNYSVSDDVIRAYGFETYTVDTKAGSDIATLYDSPYSDTLTVLPDEVTLEWGVAYSDSVSVSHAEDITINSSSADTAYFYDSSSTDTFSVNAGGTFEAVMQYTSSDVTAKGFDSIYADFSEGGNDTCNITGSTGDDELSNPSGSGTLDVDYDDSVFALDLFLTDLATGDTVNADGNGGDDDDNTGSIDYILALTDWS